MRWEVVYGAGAKARSFLALAYAGHCEGTVLPQSLPRLRRRNHRGKALLWSSQETAVPALGKMQVRGQAARSFPTLVDAIDWSHPWYLDCDVATEDVDELRRKGNEK